MAVQEQLNAREAQTAAGINKTYDAGLAAQKQGLLDAYNANTAAQTQQGQKIAQDYGTAQQDIGIQNARSNANLTQFADARGVNTNAGSQHQLNLGQTAARADAAIGYAQQQAVQENERQKALMTMNYQNQVQSALADNDYKRAAALLDDYNNNKKWQDQQAQILASYGNFDPYKQMYGDEAGTAMQSVWTAQHPDVAYRTGAIDAEAYRRITGKYPAGYTPPQTGGFDDGWYGGTPGAPKQTESLFGLNNASAGMNLGGSRGPQGHSSTTHSSGSSAGRSGKF